MPSMPKKQCVKVGCAHRVEDNKQVLCRGHRAESNARYDQERGNSNSRGYGARWRRLRKLVLNRDPICKDCNVAPSTDADHIVAKRDGGRDTMDNLQGLCHECHSAKTATENGRWGK